MSGSGSVPSFRGEGGLLFLSTTGGKLLASLSPLYSSLLILFVMVSASESVPTQDFRVGQKEVVVTSGRSLYWPISSSVEGGLGGDELNLEKRTAVQPIQLCGYRLLEAVRGLCRGNYVGYNRRSDPDMQDGHQLMMRNAPVLSNQAHRHRHQDSYAHHSRFRRNIIDECCMKACSVNEMLRYCGRT